MKKYSEEEKRMWVEDWKESGSSLWAYAKANGLCPPTLQKWILEKQEPQGFVEIPVKIEAANNLLPEILIEKGKIKIHIPAGLSRNDLRAVIESLGSEA
jgi:transposase-like protein